MKRKILLLIIGCMAVQTIYCQSEKVIDWNVDLDYLVTMFDLTVVNCPKILVMKNCRVKIGMKLSVVLSVHDVDAAIGDAVIGVVAADN